jgi:hypothetical protein
MESSGMIYVQNLMNMLVYSVVREHTFISMVPFHIKDRGLKNTETVTAWQIGS